MPGTTKRDDLQHAVDLVFFEQWLRFYFIVEEGGRMFIRLPKDELDSARDLYPQLYPVANALNNCEIDHQSAMNALCENLLNGPFAMTGQQWADVLAGPEFELALQLLSFWVEAEEERLDAMPMPFHLWKERFRIWSETPDIRDMTRLISGDEAQVSRIQ